MDSERTPGEPTPDHDLGLRADVRTLLERRGLLRMAGGLSLLGLAGCAADSTSGGGSPSSSGASGSSAAAGGDVDTLVPHETAGPFPGDGSNGPDVLDDSGIVRRDIRSSFDTATTTAEGVPLTINLTVTDSSADYAALSGAAVYVWQCDAEGGYSMYSEGLEQENYLRGVQETDGEGTVRFTSIVPGCYPGRWPHIHFEVYGSLSDATSDGPVVKTSQIALPRAACEAVYAEGGYEASVDNLAELSLTGDGVFGDDGGVHQLATMTGSVAKGYVANLTIGV